MNYEILCRRLDDPVPSWSKPGIRYVLEYWIPDYGYPVGQLWVHDYCGGYVDWLLVSEEHRRHGIATRLIETARRRWPDLAFDGATELGEAFVKSLQLKQE